MWFRKKTSPQLPEMKLCEQCRHYFKLGYETTWPNLCQICGKPHRERAAREEIVVKWARQNWEKLEPRALRENKKAKVDSLRSISEVQRAQQQAFSNHYENLITQNFGSRAMPYYINPFSASGGEG